LASLFDIYLRRDDPSIDGQGIAFDIVGGVDADVAVQGDPLGVDVDLFGALKDEFLVVLVFDVGGLGADADLAVGA